VLTNNHDTQRGTAIYYKDAPYYDLANAFMLAWPYGHPSVMSSFAFDRSTQAGRDSTPPSDAAGNTTPVYAAGTPSCAAVPGSAPVGTWVCEHRTRSVANMACRAVGTSPVVNSGTTERTRSRSVEATEASSSSTAKMLRSREP
jgi:alpha-amylase